MYIQTMDVTDKTIPMSSDEGTVPVGEVAAEKGFFGMLVQSIFEVRFSTHEASRAVLIAQPGANNAVILAMNVSFFLLLVVLFGLAFLTDWDFHVLMMLVVSTLLWASMIWQVMSLQFQLIRLISQVRNRASEDNESTRQHAT
jgi:hypothetical protein